MPPWKKNNPFDGESKSGESKSSYPPGESEAKYTGKKRNPKHDSIVEVVCEGCMKPINIRLTEKNKGKKTMSCHNCLHVIEVHFSESGGVRVYQAGKMGEGRHETGYTTVWHEGN